MIKRLTHSTLYSVNFLFSSLDIWFKVFCLLSNSTVVSIWYFHSSRSSRTLPSPLVLSDISDQLIRHLISIYVLISKLSNNYLLVLFDFFCSMFLLIFSQTYLKFSYIPTNVTFSLREACHYAIERPATEGGGGDGGEGGGGGDGEGERREMLKIPCTRWEFDTSTFTSTLTSEVSNTDRGFCNSSKHASTRHYHKSANNYSSRVGITDLQLRQHE